MTFAAQKSSNRSSDIADPEGSPKTRREIDDLKNDWLADPIWDLETTEGFEAHHAELLEFSTRIHAERTRRNEEEFAAFSAAVGCTDNQVLAHEIKRLRDVVEKLQKQVWDLEDAQLVPDRRTSSAWRI